MYHSLGEPPTQIGPFKGRWAPIGGPNYGLHAWAISFWGIWVICTPIVTK